MGAAQVVVVVAVGLVGGVASQARPQELWVALRVAVGRAGEPAAAGSRVAVAMEAVVLVVVEVVAWQAEVGMAEVGQGAAEVEAEASGGAGEAAAVMAAVAVVAVVATQVEAVAHVAHP